MEKMSQVVFGVCLSESCKFSRNFVQPTLGMAENSREENVGLLRIWLQLDCSQKRIDSLTKLSLAIVGDSQRQLELCALVEDPLRSFQHLNRCVEILVQQQHISEIEIIDLLF